MPYSNFTNGFKIQSKAAIDRRMYLTKAEMVAAETLFPLLPDCYFAICPDDGKLYIYNKANTATATTGKYKPVEELINFTDPTFKAKFDAAVENSAKIIQVNQEIQQINNTIENEIKPAVTLLQSDVDILEEKVGDDQSGLIKRIADAEASIGSIEPRIDQAEEDITEIERRLDDIKLDDIKGTLDGGLVS